MRDVLTRDVRKKRNQTNSITLAGQFYSFITEMLLLCIVLATRIVKADSIPSQLKEIVEIIKLTDFGILCIVQIMTSPVLKEEFKRLFIY